MIYGYVRVSTQNQNIERQITNILRDYPMATIKSEKFTGTKIEGRKVFNELLKIVKPGDTIVFDSVSRMSRNAEEGFNLYEELFNKGIKLVFLKESYINTSVYKKQIDTSESISINGDSIVIKETEKFIKNILLGLAKEQIIIAFNQSEKEVKDLQQRTKEGINVARLNGKQIGRVTGTTIETNKSKIAKEMILKHSKKFGGSLNDKECIALIKVAKATFYKYVKELEEALWSSSFLFYVFKLILRWRPLNLTLSPTSNLRLIPLPL